MNQNGAMTIVEDDASIMGSMVRPDATANTMIQLAAATLDKQIVTARQFPRSIARFKQEAGELLREDVETARSAEYAKPVGGGTVKGPSVRLMELASMCWGNLIVEVSEPVISDKNVFVSASAWDLQRNLRMPGTASTSIIKRDGTRFPGHMIETAAAATASKAKRNAILNIIPRAYVTDLLNIAKKVAAGTEKPMEQRRIDMLDHFARQHRVTAEQVFARLEIGGIDDMTEDTLADLRAIATSLKDGESKVEEWFSTPTESKTEALKAKLAERQQKAVKPVLDAVAVPASPPPPDAEAPKKPAEDRLAELIKDYESKGGIIEEFAERHETTAKDIKASKGKARSEWCTKLWAEIRQMPEPGQMFKNEPSNLPG